MIHHQSGSCLHQQPRQRLAQLGGDWPRRSLAIVDDDQPQAGIRPSRR
jgi:hypothetical protein